MAFIEIGFASFDDGTQLHELKLTWNKKKKKRCITYEDGLLHCKHMEENVLKWWNVFYPTTRSVKLLLVLSGSSSLTVRQRVSGLAAVVDYLYSSSNGGACN